MGGSSDNRDLARPGRDQAAGGGLPPPSSAPPPAAHLITPAMAAVLDDLAWRWDGAYEVAAWLGPEETWTGVRLDDGGSLTAPGSLPLLTLIRADSVRPVERRERILGPQAQMLREEYRPRGWCVIELHGQVLAVRGGRAVGPMSASAAGAQLYCTRFEDARARALAVRAYGRRASGRGVLRSSA